LLETAAGEAEVAEDALIASQVGRVDLYVSKRAQKDHDHAALMTLSLICCEECDQIASTRNEHQDQLLHNAGCKLL
jgi:hypothetical protein